MTKQIVMLGLVIFISLPKAFCQSVADTIVAYDVATQNTVYILPSPVTSTLTSDFTSSSPGSMGNTVTLSQTAPVSNLFPGSNFSKPARAADIFPLSTYPARTAVRLKEYTPDYQGSVCTGMIVGPCLVLTSAACITKFGPVNAVRKFDSIRVQPAFNNGLPAPGLPTATVKKIHVFKKFLRNVGWEDIALLELSAPIGNTLGWTGIGFSEDTSFTTAKVFHKFSYPADSIPGFPGPPYNGDTLYYNYGNMSAIPGAGNFYQVLGATAVPGQGGSTFLYTNNSSYYSVGLCSFSNNYSHYKISKQAFYRFKTLINGFSCSSIIMDVNEKSTIEKRLIVYPNPFNDQLTIDFDYNPVLQYSLSVYDQSGNEVYNGKPQSGKIMLPRGDLARGLYFVKLSSSSGDYFVAKALAD